MTAVGLPKARLITDALLVELRQAPVLVGDGETPDGAGWPASGGPFVPHANLHPIPGGVTSGTVERPDDDAEMIYQVTAVGSTREQCEWVADECRDVLLHSAPSIDGRSVMGITHDMMGGSRRDDTLGAGQLPVWIAVDRYRVYSTPS